MRTIFTAAPFAQAQWTPRGPSLGLSFADFFGEVASAAPDVYQAYQAKERAEEERKKAEAQAAAAAAQAQAAASQAVASQAQAKATEVLGIPISYWVIGGLGLAGIGIVLAVTSK